MKRIFASVILSFFLLSCSTFLGKSPSPGSNVPLAVLPEDDSRTPTPPAVQPAEIEKGFETGMVFARTDFQGVVKTSYVRLSIVDKSDSEKVYQLYIGDKERQKVFPWNIQTVQSGYFFIELPVGDYRFKSLSIPVGTTLATEAIDISFRVQKGAIAYLGFLKVSGTDEKVKFGGVPIIQPGFLYSLEVLDNREEAFQELHKRFPDLKLQEITELMHVHKYDNKKKYSF